ncbi:hypothetical protein ONZ45_g6519 [Pleurotus djamor]|nr:hypothetical protein ONZ45_g6519 [Pleurotus djamor]
MSPLSSITPALINQVNTAASTNPTLANLLQLAATGRATPDQLKTLGLLIQSLATVGSMNPSLEPGSLQQPVRPFDLVLEFPECPYDRFLFPRCQVVCERMSNNTLSTYQDILIAAPIPFSTETDASAPSTTAAPVPTTTTSTTTTTATATATATATTATPPPVPPCLQVATMRIKSAPVTLWETLSKWMGDEETVSRNRQYLSRLQPSRVYLAHRIREGPLLTELQTLSAPNFTMKSIDPTAPGGVKPKRKYTKREPKPKPAAVPKIAPPSFLVLTPQPQPPPVTQAGPSVVSTTSQPPSVLPVPPLTIPSVLASSSSTTPYPTPPIATASSTPSTSTSTPTPGPPPSKKQRVKPPKQPLPRIACFSCDMTDVPLIMGGRFCRPCVESGKANPDIPQPLRSTGSTHRSYYQPVTPSSTAQSAQSSQGTTK